MSPLRHSLLRAAIVFVAGGVLLALMETDRLGAQLLLILAVACAVTFLLMDTTRWG